MTENNESSVVGALQGLIDKYGPSGCNPWALTETCREFEKIPPPIRRLISGTLLIDTPECDTQDIILFPWRCHRRYVELRNMYQGAILETPSMIRTRFMAPPGLYTLRQAMYREFDLLQWITGSSIVSIFACITDDLAANLALQLDNDVRCGMELAVNLPADGRIHDRHEIFTQRGVACDQVVDSIVRPDSMYCFTRHGTKMFTDIDAELFGLNQEQVILVRSAHEALRHNNAAEQNAEIHRELCSLVELAVLSNERCERIDAKARVA